MMKKPKDGMVLRIAIAASLPVVMVLLLVVVGIDTKNIADRVIEIRTEINTRTKQSQDIIRLRGEAEKAEGEKTVLENILPQKDELFSFSDQVTAAGTDNSVNTNFSFADEREGRIGYNLVGAGSYVDIADFVKSLEDDIPFMVISSFSINLVDTEYNIDLRGNVFFNGQE